MLMTRASINEYQQGVVCSYATGIGATQSWEKVEHETLERHPASLGMSGSESLFEYLIRRVSSPFRTVLATSAPKFIRRPQYSRDRLETD